MRLYNLVESLHYSEEELLSKREEKKEECGGFKEGIVLKKVI